MEPHLEHTHGRHYDDPDTLTASYLTGHDHNEDEHHGEKKSVIKKVKEKAKKLKNTITKHGHDHNHHDDHDDDDDDDDDDETIEDPEVHGAPMYDSARVVGLGGPDAILEQPRGNLERPSVMAEDRYTEPWARQRAAPPVSAAAYGANLSEPLGLGHTQAYGPQNWRGKIGQPTGMEEDPFAPNPTSVATPSDVTNPTYGTRRGGDGQDVNQKGFRGIIGKSTGMVEDPHAPKDPSRLGSDPSNYETKVIDPTHAGGKEANLSQIQHSFDKMGIRDDEHNSGYDPNHPENLPRETLTGKISSSASAIAEKAAVAKDVIASKIGYSSQNPATTGSEEPVKNSGSATDYAHKITDKVTGTLAPVYEKVVDAGSSVISKVQGTVSGTGTGTESGTVTAEKDKMADKGVSVKEYLMETLRPGHEDKALSEVITHAFHRGNHGESEKKSHEDKPMGIVTESVEVRQRLGTDRQEENQQQNSGNVSADKNVTDRLRDAVGSWFGEKGDAPQGTLGTTYVTDHGLSSNPAGDYKSGSG